MNRDTLLSTSISLVTLRTEAVFFQRFAQLIASDVPLLRAIEIAADELTNHEFRKVIREIKFRLEQGESITDAFRQYPNYFSKFAIAIIDTGEKDGRLDENFSKLAESLHREIENRKTAVTAANPAVQTQPSYHSDVSAISDIATQFAEHFITALEKRLNQPQREISLSAKLKQELCPKCRKKIGKHLHLSAKKPGYRKNKP